MNKQRENLIEELKANLECISFIELRYERIADWIIADRKRICEPLVKLSNKKVTTDSFEMDFANAIVETLNRAGVK